MVSVNDIEEGFKRRKFVEGLAIIGILLVAFGLLFLLFMGWFP